jgi:hypothetical protein
MQCDNPRTKGWKKLNLVRNVMFFNQAIKGCAKDVQLTFSLSNLLTHLKIIVVQMWVLFTRAI